MLQGLVIVLAIFVTDVTVVVLNVLTVYFSIALCVFETTRTTRFGW